ncbi:MAG: hypothetical protein WCI71_06025 [Bacteroidota bacterium]
MLEVYLMDQNLVNFSLLEFESISKKYSGSDTNYIIGNISSSNPLKVYTLLPKLDVFLAFTENFLRLD